MLPRVIRKLIVAASVMLAIVLGVLGSRTRQTDLIAGYAKASLYHEVRIGDGKIGVMWIDWWPKDEPITWGRPPIPWAPTYLQAQLRNTTGPFVRMLDGAVLKLDDSGISPSPWQRLSPVTRTDGRATLVVPTAMHLVARMMPPGTSFKRPATATASSFVFIPSTRGASAPTTTVTMLATPAGTATVKAIGIPTGTLTLPPPLTELPDFNKITVTVPEMSFTPTRKPAEEPASGLEALNAARQEPLALRVLPKPAPPPKRNVISFGTSVTLGAGPPIAIYRYVRYTLPLWLVVAVVLVPLWWSLLAAIVRRRRRRQRRRRGQCEQCGYDLRGTLQADACPECGHSTGRAPATAPAAS
jgi:hypothetical protein